MLPQTNLKKHVALQLHTKAEFKWTIVGKRLCGAGEDYKRDYDGNI